MRSPVRRTARLAVALAAAALASLALAAPAPAAKNLVSIFQDDRVLTREGAARRDAGLGPVRRARASGRGAWHARPHEPRPRRPRLGVGLPGQHVPRVPAERA